MSVFSELWDLGLGWWVQGFKTLGFKAFGFRGLGVLGACGSRVRRVAMEATVTVL